MTLKQAKKLHTGDEVYWTDPTGNDKSAYFTISEIALSTNGKMAYITDLHGQVLECPIKELS